MITSTLTFYKTNIHMDKNLFIEQIDKYLDTCEHMTINDFMYVKHALEVEIKVTADIQGGGYYDDATNFEYDYVKIHNVTETLSAYYYVYKSEWRSNGCVKLTLLMDTINSFQQFKNCFTKRTQILREHKNAVWANGIEESGNTFYIPRVVDTFFEDITPQLYKRYQKTITHGISPNESYYLVYRAEHNLDSGESSNPVKCYLYSKNGTTLINSNKYTFYPRIFRNDIYMYTITRGTTIRFFNSSNVESYNEYIVGDVYLDSGVYYRIQALYFRVMMDTNFNYYFVIGCVRQNTNDATISQATICNNTLDNMAMDIIISPTFNPDNIKNFVMKTSGDLSHPSDLNELEPYDFHIEKINAVDMTDARLVKVIEIPYLPVKSSSISTFAYDDGNKWQFDVSNSQGHFQFLDITQEFSEIIVTDNLDEELDTFYLKINSTYVSSAQQLKTYMNAGAQLYDDYESKCYHSSFFIHKFAYDSFTKDFPIESYDIDELSALSPKVTFKATSTINSRFGFKISRFSFAYAYADYPEYLVVSRNNEKTIYTTNYLNYLRSGYNYDKKNKDISIAMGWLGATGGVIGGAISGATMGGPVGALVGGVLGGATGVINAIRNSITTENAWSSKIAQMKEQSANIQTSDDIDLFNWYSSNKLRLFSYSCSTTIRTQLIELFNLYGYKTSYYAIPNVESRVWWNFLQCKADFTKIQIGDKDLDEEYINDIKARLENGVTFIHCVNDAIYDTRTFDILQQKNNIDVALYDKLKQRI